MELKEIVAEALKAKGLNGLFFSEGCVCTLDDLMPCDDPAPSCEGCKLKPATDCGD